MQVDIEIIAGVGRILADQAILIGFLNGNLEVDGFLYEFAANIDIGRNSAHGETGNQTSFQKSVRIEPHNFPILTGAGLGFVGIDHKIAWAAIGFLGHERPF